MVKNHSHKHHPAPFHVDDLMLVHRAAFRTNHNIADLNKFDDRWLGPFPITKVINENAYELALPQSFKAHKVINITFLRPYHTSSKFPRLHPDALSLPPVESDTQNVVSNYDDVLRANDEVVEYEVETILDCRLTREFCKQIDNKQGSHKGRKRINVRPLREQLELSSNINDYEFLVKWKGYPLYDATWEPLAHLGGSPKCLNELVRDKQLPETWLHKEDSETPDKE